MASKLHMKFSLTAREEIDAGSSQIHSVIDSTAQRVWGGSYNTLYTPATNDDGANNIKVYESAKVKYAALDTSGHTTDLAGGTWANINHANYVTRGTSPGELRCFCLELVELAGTASWVAVGWMHNSFIILENTNECCLLPLNAASMSNIDIWASVADDNTNFVRVNVLVAGGAN